MSNNDKISITHLPEEALEKILSYVPEQFIVSQVCKTFYKISCRLNTFGLKMYRYGKPDDVYGEDIFRSMLNSERKIDSIYVSIDPNLQCNKDTDVIKKIIKNFGQSVKKFELRFTKLNLIDLLMLNLMPNLEQLELKFIEFKDNKIDQDFELINLRKLTIYCAQNSPIIPQFFDRLPKDILRECDLLTLSRLPQNLSEKQSKLKKLRILLDGDEEINLSGMKELMELKLCDKIIKQEGLDHICTELKSLETLQIGEISQLQNLSILRDLTNLKKLKLGAVKDENESLLRSIEHSTLGILDLDKASLSTFRELSFKCPKLRELNVAVYDSSNFSELLDLFPELERLGCPLERFKITEGWENQNLKYLEFNEERAWESDVAMKRLPPIVRSCKGLKTISTSLALNEDTTKQLMMENSNLKSLCVTSPTVGVIQTIKNYGEKLDSLHVRNISREAFEKLKEVYPLANKSVSQWDFSNCLMFKNKGKVEKCCKLLEVDDELILKAY